MNSSGLVAAFEYAGGVEVSDELGFGVAPVAVDADLPAPQALGDGPGQGGLADADRALQQHVSAGFQAGQHGSKLRAAPDDAVGRCQRLEIGKGAHTLSAPLRKSL